MSDYAGQQIGNYHLLSELASGAFGSVYLAQHTILTERRVAVKVLHTYLHSSQEREQFVQEARFLEQLRHPHILSLLDVGVQNNLPYLVTAYAPGGSLRNLLKQSAPHLLSTERALSILAQIGQGLQYAHQKGIIHRDLKPENILFTAQGAVLLADFGLATMLSTVSMKYMTTIGGTPSYMAPEQFQGTISKESDQYALGCIAYELFTGRPPFSAPDFISMGFHHATKEPNPLTDVNPNLPLSIQQAILTAMAKQREKRHPDVAAFITMLCTPSHDALPPPVREDDIPTIVSTKASPPQEGVKTHVVAPHEILSPADQESLARAQETSQDKEFLSLDPDSSHHRLTTFNTPSAAFQQPLPSTPSPERTMLTRHRVPRRAVLFGLALLAVGGGGIAWYEFSHLSLSSPTTHSAGTLPPASTTRPSPPSQGALLSTYHGHSDSVGEVAWSSDGMSVASASLDGTIQIWRATDATHLLTYTQQASSGVSNAVETMAWSPNGKDIASGGAEDVQVWNAVDGKGVYTYHVNDYHNQPSGVNAVAWSPDSKRIASGYSGTTVQVWNAVDGGASLIYHGHTAAISAVAWSPDGKRLASAETGSAGAGGKVQVWDATSGATMYTYRGHSDYVSSVAWSPDGKNIASGSGDRTVQVWNAADGSNVSIYRGHSDYVSSVAWSPDGKNIASGSGDKTIQIWDATNGRRLYTYRGHTAEVNTAKWSPDGKRIASGSYDKTVQVWAAV